MHLKVIIWSWHFFKRLGWFFLCHFYTIFSLYWEGIIGLKIFLLSWNRVIVIIHFRSPLPTRLLEAFLFLLWPLYGCRTKIRLIQVCYQSIRIGWYWQSCWVPQLGLDIGFVSGEGCSWRACNHVLFLPPGQ